MTNTETKKIVREAYGKIAMNQEGCGSDCGPNCVQDTKDFAKGIGYTDEELQAIPDEANLGLSCGNPTALASLNKGESVLDLGAGAGFDCFLAASRVGPAGKVIGVDMTSEMLEKARENARKNDVENVDFRLGEIENLPVEDDSIDAVISNCVINLSTDKERVFEEIYRVLKPGGRIAISDMALLKELPKKIKDNMDSYVGCISGAMLINDYRKAVEASGLKDVKITFKGSTDFIDPDTQDPIGKALLDITEGKESLDRYVVSINVEGKKIN